MGKAELKKYLLTKPEAFEDYPFGPDAAVFKIKGKMFALLHEKDNLVRVNLKCDPAQAILLRDIFESVLPGYHMNKAHWNTVLLDGLVPTDEIERMIDHSYTLVVKGLKKKERIALEVAFGPDNLYKI